MAEDATTGGTARNTRRHELRATNLKTWETGGLEGDLTGTTCNQSSAETARKRANADLGSLDSSLKRNTAFIKRLRSSLQSPESVAALIKEVNLLSLEKYTSELVSATTEGLTRCKTASEIAGSVEVVSALHQRFPEVVSSPLVASLQASLQPPSKAVLATLPAEQRDRDENARVLRQRGLLRIFAELELVGIVKPDKRTSLGDATFVIFKDLLTADKELLVTSIPLAVAFTKHLGATFMSASTDIDTPGPTPSESVEESATADGDSVPTAVKDKFRKLLMAYYDALSRRAIRDHTQLLETDRKNHDAYIRSGEIFEDRAQTYEKMARSWEKLWNGVQSLSESLAVPLPTLPPLANNTIVTGMGTSLLNKMNAEDGTGQPGSVWADDEERRFYTDLMDLRGEVPGSLLKTGEEGKEDTKPALKDLEAEAKAETTEEPVDPSVAIASEVDDGLAPQPAAQLAALFARLPDTSNRDSIDKAAVEFTFLNSKPARRRLVKLVFGVPRNRQDLLPYYARLVATLNQYMPDIGTSLVSLLEEEFRYFQRKKGQDLAESRSKNVRFLSELTKFGITPSHSILHVFKVCLDDFSGSNLDNICTLLDNCGRYLLRSEATREKMAAMLDTMKRKKNVANLDQRQVTMLENSYYQCDPPDRPVVVPKERTPMQLFIRHLLYDVLVKGTLEKVVKILRKMHWEDPEIVRKLYNAFTKVWKIKFSNVYLFAILLHDLARYHSEFCVSVVDGVLENIVVGMEHNNFKYNQQRVATVKYLGELYTYRMVDAKVVLDTLWSLATFGHPEGRPTPNSPSVIDTADDYFRIRLVCTLLDTCGVYFDRGLLRKKMDNFLTFFQMYTKTKRQPAPMDIDFMLSDTFETLRPKFAQYATFEDAAKAVDDMFAKASVQITAAEVIQEAELEDEADEGARIRPDVQQESSEDEAEVQPEVSSEDSDSSDAESESSISSEDGVPDTEEQDEFERDLARMMADTGGDFRRTGNKSALSETLPTSLKRQQPAGDDDGSSANMKFTLLMKRGTKQQTRGVEIPRESALAMHTLNKQQMDKAEQQQLKRLVLNYEQREDAENRKTWVDDAGRRGFKIKFAG